jgi:hypothetical protein
MTSKPIVVHACHCSWCQRETGTAFATNAVIERSRVELLGATPLIVDTPSHSGKGQKIHRCPKCHVAVWSNYAGGGDDFAFIRVGSLDDPSAMPPDIHIFTSTKQTWFAFPAGARVYPEFYDPKSEWPQESLARWAAVKGPR